MPTKRIDDEEWLEATCMHPEHEPPKHMVFPPGKYEHTCPACGKKIIFFVPKIIA